MVFKTDSDFRYYLKLIYRYKLEYPFDLYHYCLLPNHTHFLIQTKNALDFAIFMKKLNLAYFHHYRKYYGWVGHFWQDRYKSQTVGKDDYFIQCGKYIELNPVRKKLVDNPGKWLHSSYRHYALNVQDDLITADIFYNDLGMDLRSREKNYADLIVDSIVEESYTKKIWGSNNQRYNEQQKISRKRKKPKSERIREPSP